MKEIRNIEAEHNTITVSVATPYDDVLRTILTDCSELIIPIINEIFNEKNTEIGKVIFDVNEHFINGKNGVQHKKITDSAFMIESDEDKDENSVESTGKVITNRYKRRYHIECETNAGIKILKREFEYDSQIALHNGIVSENELTVQYPKSAIIFLRSRKKHTRKYEYSNGYCVGKDEL